MATQRTIVLACFTGVLLLLPSASAQCQSNPATLQLSISPQQPFVAEPQAARIVLRLHNPTAQTLWLYRRARGKRQAEEFVTEEHQRAINVGTSIVSVTLQPADAKVAQAASSPAQGTVLEYVQMPKPRLVKLAPGGDYEETSIIHLQPAMADGQKSIWGAYRLTAVYSASFSNADLFQRNLGAELWQGEVTSNAIAIELRPALPDSVGVVSGSALGPDLQPRADIRVSLSDESGQLINQQVTGGDGKFSFTQLPLALYWVTARRENAAEDTVTYRHQELTSASPSVSTQLVLYPIENPEAKNFVHKPVLLRVYDAAHNPLGGIDIDALFSNGDVVDDLKAVTGDDGTAVMALLPGRISITLKKHGCAEQVERLDVGPGAGVDGSRYVLNCAKK